MSELIRNQIVTNVEANEMFDRIERWMKNIRKGGMKHLFLSINAETEKNIIGYRGEYTEIKEIFMVVLENGNKSTYVDMDNIKSNSLHNPWNIYFKDMDECYIIGKRENARYHKLVLGNFKFCIYIKTEFNIFLLICDGNAQKGTKFVFAREQKADEDKHDLLFKLIDKSWLEENTKENFIF